MGMGPMTSSGSNRLESVFGSQSTKAGQILLVRLQSGSSCCFIFFVLDAARDLLEETWKGCEIRVSICGSSDGVLLKEILNLNLNRMSVVIK
jgi:hypothetical protein